MVRRKVTRWESRLVRMERSRPERPRGLGAVPSVEAVPQAPKIKQKPKRLLFYFEVPSGIEPLYLVLQTSA